MDTPAADAVPRNAATEHTNERRHRVYFTTSARRFYIKHPNHGVTLRTDEIVWTFAGKPDGAPFTNITEVHLQSGGAWQTPINLCQITFADRYKLIVTNGNEYGIPNDEQRAHYRDFVHDLLARLAARAPSRSGAPAFNAGYPASRYLFLLVLAAILGLIFIGVPL